MNLAHGIKADYESDYNKLRNKVQLGEREFKEGFVELVNLIGTVKKSQIQEMNIQGAFRAANIKEKEKSAFIETFKNLTKKKKENIELIWKYMEPSDFAALYKAVSSKPAKRTTESLEKKLSPLVRTVMRVLNGKEKLRN